jgi:uncharacterized LabA/DUF88 family protein
MTIESKKYRCNHAYIDGANLHRGTVKNGWMIDYDRFYIWLKDKYRIKRAYIFIGYVSMNDSLYNKMRRAGFLVRFKDTIRDHIGQIKGNCDADLVLRSSRDVYESVFDKSIIISSDGDFSSLVDFLQEKEKMPAILSPNRQCSILLMRTNAPISYLNDFKNFVCVK